MLSKEQRIELDRVRDRANKYNELLSKKLDCYEYMDISVEAASILNESIGKLNQNNGNPDIVSLQSKYAEISREVLARLRDKNRSVSKESILFKLVESSRNKVLSNKLILNPVNNIKYDKQKRFVCLLTKAQDEIEQKRNQEMIQSGKVSSKLYYDDVSMKELSDLNNYVDLNKNKEIHLAYIDTACKYLGRDTPKERQLLKNQTINIKEDTKQEEIEEIIDIDIDIE